VIKSQNKFLIFQLVYENLRQDPDLHRHQNGKSDLDPDQHQNDADPQTRRFGEIFIIL